MPEYLAEKLNREDEFTDRLADGIAGGLAPYLVGRKKSLLYDLSFDHAGALKMGVDPETGTPFRGRGSGFEQDILVYQEVEGGQTSVVPRIVAEIKVGNVTTHDVLVYSEKADRIKRVYPYIRYGLVLGGSDSIPGRVLRLGQRFDFIVALDEQLPAAEITGFGAMMREEALASIALGKLLFEKDKPRIFRRALLFQ